MLNRPPAAAFRAVPALTGAAERRAGTAVLLAALLSLALTARAAERPEDHSKFEPLQRSFQDGSAVTRACLLCHSKAGHDMLSTAHWLWHGAPLPIPGHGPRPRSIGKANVFNNFCIGAQSNEAACSKCHIGYNWKGKTFKTYDYSDAKNIDCLVCHDTTGDYSRTPSPDSPNDWGKLARSVGPTSPSSCGTCHFNGGGGAAVKHGDLDPALEDADRSLDVHLDKAKHLLTCGSCHKGKEAAHRIVGHSPSVGVHTGYDLKCEDCHGYEPHSRRFILQAGSERGARLNWHAKRLACQTCHIPRYAKTLATRTWWDWSKAGRRDKEGEPLKVFDEEHNLTYWGIKGEFRSGSNLVPEYRWYDGFNERYLVGDKFDPSRILTLNQPLGGPEIPGSKIWPFRIMHTKQPYDEKNHYLIQPFLAGEGGEKGKKGTGAYWVDFDWDRAAKAGMAYVGLPFSGQIGFTETEMYWPLNHMVVDRTQALSCDECHSRKGRLAGLPGIYVPGQSRSLWLEILGWLAVVGAFLGVVFHAAKRARGRV